MLISKYGTSGPKVLLAHGLFCNENAFRTFMNHLPDYQFVVPTFDAHYENPKTEWPGFPEEARRLADHLNASGDIHFDLALGVSFGGLVLLELMKRNDVLVDHWILDGTPLFSFGPLRQQLQLNIFRLLLKTVPKRSDEAVYNRNGWVGLNIKNGARTVTINDLKRIIPGIHKATLPHPNSTKEATVTFVYGSEEIALKSSKALENWPDESYDLMIAEGCGHTDWLNNNPIDYAAFVRSIVE